jgi:hypothetical protein
MELVCDFGDCGCYDHAILMVVVLAIEQRSRGDRDSPMKQETCKRRLRS